MRNASPINQKSCQTPQKLQNESLFRLEVVMFDVLWKYHLDLYGLGFNLNEIV